MIGKAYGKIDMTAYWWNKYSIGHGNFGDMLVPKILKFLTGQDFKHSDIPCEGQQRLLTIGSLLGNNHRIYDNDIIWGTGAMYPIPLNLKLLSLKAKVHMVRGPLTKKFCDSIHLRCPAIYGDPGIFAPLAYSIERSKNPLFEYGIVPHITDYKNKLAYITTQLQQYRDNGIKIILINPTDSPEVVLSQIAKCKQIISSSLHGIICAEAFGIPTYWVEFSDAVEGNGFKFYDYFHGTRRLDVCRHDFRKMIDFSKLNCNDTPTFNVVEMLATFPLKINNKNRVIDYFSRFH